MRTLATVNQKGGSGKTTTAVNLAAALGESGRRILLIDADAQASASRWLGCRDGGRGLYDVFVGDAGLAGNIRSTDVPGVELIPSSGTWLAGADRVLANRAGAETILRERIGELGNEWDYLIIDCPPALSILTINALTAVEELLVPVETHIMALDGLVALLQTVAMVQERLNPGLRIAGIVACRFDSRTRHGGDVVNELRQRFGDNVHATVIHENVRVAECPSFAQPVTRYDTRSTGAADYRALAREILEHEGDSNGSSAA